MNKLTVRKNILAALLIITVAIFIFAPKLLNADPAVGDPSGLSTGNASNISSAVAGSPTLNEIANEVGKTKIGLNFVWVMLSAFLIFFFQAGFAMVETGLTRAKNALHTMSMNLVVFLIGTIGFYILGFALMMGGAGPLSALGGTAVLNKELALGGWGILGFKGFFLSGNTYD